VNCAAQVPYAAAKAHSAAAHRFDEAKSISDNAIAMQACAKQAKDIALIAQAEIRMRAERRAGGLVRDKAVQAPSFPSPTFIGAPAITDLAGISTVLDAIVGITQTQNVSGATGHHAHRADHFVRQHQRHHHRGIDNHGLYTPPQPWESGTFGPSPLPQNF
jgi:hypothetical protein